MDMKRWLWVIIITFMSFAAWGQEKVDLTGQWKGSITQDPAKYKALYEFEVYLKQKGNIITGHSFVYVDSIHAQMTLRGELHSNVFFRFEELEIVDYKASMGMEWCIKKGQLILKEEKGVWKLEGFWQGNTSFSECVPGKIFLEKKIPRA